MIRAKYDELADVLYIVLDQARRAFGDEQPDGLVFRYDYDSKNPCGVTVLEYSHWATKPDALATRVSQFLKASPAEVRRALEGAAHHA